MHDISLRVPPDPPGSCDAKSHRVQQVPGGASHGMLSSAPEGQQSSFPVPSSQGCVSVVLPGEPEPTPDPDPLLTRPPQAAPSQRPARPITCTTVAGADWPKRIRAPMDSHKCSPGVLKFPRGWIVLWPAPLIPRCAAASLRSRVEILLLNRGADKSGCLMDLGFRKEAGVKKSNSE